MLRARREIARIVTAFALCLAAVSAAYPAGGPPSLEYPVKANYLVRFSAFVAWPQEAFAGADTPLSICVVGVDPFGPELDKAAAGQAAHGRAITVRRLAETDPGAGCHIVFVGRMANGAAEVERLRAGPVLVVTDEASGSARGAIQFVIIGDRVRFKVDEGVLGRGVAMDSRLLSLAVSVRGAP